MRAHLHEDLAEYWALAGPLYSADPVLYTFELHLAARLRQPDSDPAAALITFTDLDHLVGAALGTSQGLVCNAMPTAGITAAVNLLADNAIPLPSVRGSRAVTLAVADAWLSRTGVTVCGTTDERLYRLLDLIKPRVAGEPLLVAAEEIESLVPWSVEYSRETFGVDKPADEAGHWLIGSYRLGDVYLCWERGGAPVAMAGVRAPIEGVSRVGPVYTPPPQRGHGYGSAVAAAACEWARQAGAREIVLTTDLANPTSNSIYRKLGFRAVTDSVIVEFA
ncbi:GNAT family N-acetyltransferase [Mycobacteroides chelonae]|uniref:GNAT family N-acetyltransferase n=1 Tax=Mycobacteroides chelonae TaxID=1774 RepID=A0A1S1M1T0_MYCCH|nr:GNAT family N-acetyltransferase [Mycobacteroides chelonae]OHU76503.1 GNAT family N-acetyltransferase [Mycobacteroides chelonae]QQG87839.1 GNAT family N-acetyltransferase [Mycobacteroides chelonae]QQG92656.1 GNAT family N-acetyltransferase [Mycobacteroides chelonae]